MQTVRLALIGFGNVGQGLVQILQERGDIYAQEFGIKFNLVSICDLLRGSVYYPEGLNPAAILDAVQGEGSLDQVIAKEHGWDAFTTIQKSNADVVVEASYSDLNTGEPAISHIKLALQSGKHVVTTNKGPVALCFAELDNLARINNLQIGVEGTVMSGTPAIRLGLDVLKGAGVFLIEGILNGTTNYILTQMENGYSYQQALVEAQGRGYAESDPTGDVEGFDAAGKVVILSTLLMGMPLTMDQVDRTGIKHLTGHDMAQAQENGKRWKLIGRLEKSNQGVKASVKPVCLPLDNPLSSVSGATNAIKYSTKLLGEVTLIGPGAGRLETGYALISDLLRIYRR